MAWEGGAGKGREGAEGVDVDYASTIIHRQDGEFYPVAANYGQPVEWLDVVKRNPIREDRGSATGRAALERRVIHIPDILADPDYRWAKDQRGEDQMHRTILAVPMLREGAVIGVIVIRRIQVQPFTTLAGSRTTRSRSSRPSPTKR